jgi:predicted SAM-dependent methyltransferase
MCDVLEHVPFPLPALRGVFGALRPGGILFLSSPNRASLAWEVLDDEDVNPYWSEGEHCHNFSYPQLRNVLRDVGFEPLSCSVSNRYRVSMDVLARRPTGIS